MNISIDVGGTKISAALINNDQIIDRVKADSIIHTELSNLAPYLFDLCKHWRAKATHVSVACTGQVGLTNVNFLSAKSSLPLKVQLERLFNLPIAILNDAAAAAWAEYNAITNVLDETLVYITVSTGIGGGIIQNGTLVTSTNGFCAHLGHMSVHHSSDKNISCHCGRINCVEAITSGTALAKQATEILKQTVTCKDVFEHHTDHPEIVKLISDGTNAVTDLIANIKAATGTSIVVLGGSVGSSTIFFNGVCEKVKHLPEIYQVSVLPASTGADADIIGAYLYAKQLNS